jgi:hypothetical protein
MTGQAPGPGRQAGAERRRTLEDLEDGRWRKFRPAFPPTRRTIDYYFILIKIVLFILFIANLSTRNL